MRFGRDTLRLPHAVSNPTSLVGIAIVTMSAALFIILVLLETFGFLVNPYLGLLIFVTLPLVFLAGLALVPLGAWRDARRRARGLAPTEWPVVDLRQPRQRMVTAAVLVLTFVNIVIVSLAAYGGVHYMESTEFCGQVCHVTMEPEFVAHRAWPHARVACTDCHVGPGVTSSLEAKLAGTRQLWHLMRGEVPRPIPTPVASTRRMSGTCTQCHAPNQFLGNSLREIKEYADDEESSETVTRLLMKVGGADQKGSGSHRHLGLQIEYVATDESREVIPYVRVTDPGGSIREYVAEGASSGEVAVGARRSMDCVDCHNRPAHTFDFSPARAIDRAIAEARLSRELPFVRREAVAAVTGEHGSQSEALEAIAARLKGFYASVPGVDGRQVDVAVGAVQAVWSQNVFPRMKVGWGSYPNQRGHVDTPGCFRCHDDSHRSADGATISQDCALCHDFE